MLTLVATQAAFCFVIYFAAGLLVKTFERLAQDRKSTRLNSSHRCTSYAVFCLKKNNFPLNPGAPTIDCSPDMHRAAVRPRHDTGRDNPSARLRSTTAAGVPGAHTKLAIPASRH